MNARRENGELIVELSGRIDTNNAAQAEEEIFRLLETREPEETLVFDADDLTYISSAGLRVLMKVRKELGAPLEIRNTSLEVYDIFEATGFTELFSVSRGLRRLSVDGCEIVGKGAAGTVYRYDPETVVKVYHEPGPKDAIAERETARKAFVFGLPTAISYEMVRVGDRYASVFEMLDAECLIDVMRASTDKLEDHAQNFVSLMKLIHAIEVPEGTFPAFKDRMRRMVEKLSADAGKPDDLTEADAAAVKAFIETLPDSMHLIHGDFHPGNVMCMGGEQMLIDLDRLSTGDPIFELSMVYVPFCGFAEIDPKDNERFLGLPYEFCQRFFKRVLELYYDLSSEEELAAKMKTIRTIAYIEMMHKMKVTRRMRDEQTVHNYFFWLKELKELLM